MYLFGRGGGLEKMEFKMWRGIQNKKKSANNVTALVALWKAKLEKKKYQRNMNYYVPIQRNEARKKL